MHLLVDARSDKRGRTLRARCGTIRLGMTADLSGWSSDVTCPECLS